MVWLIARADRLDANKRKRLAAQSTDREVSGDGGGGTVGQDVGSAKRHKNAVVTVEDDEEKDDHDTEQVTRPATWRRVRGGGLYRCG
eukprot:4277-Eustigmatos_ZCMA.PRE.1